MMNGPEGPRLPQRMVPALAALIGLFAIPVGTAGAACQMPGKQIGPAVLEGFREAPKSLLTQYPQGGFGLQGTVAQMAAAGADMIKAVVSVASLASESQRNSMGLGFAAAVNQCVMQDAGIVQRIKDAVKGTGSGSLQRSFMFARADADPAVASPVPGAQPAGTSFSMDPSGPVVRGASKLSDPFGSFEDWH